MKVDLKELKTALKEEIKRLELKIAGLEDEIKQTEAVERIALRLEKRDPVDQALEELKKGTNGKPNEMDGETAEKIEKKGASKEDENLDWAFQA